MNSAKAVEELNALHGDETIAHHRADDILCEFIEAKGYPEVAKAFADAKARVGFWYE